MSGEECDQLSRHHDPDILSDAVVTWAFIIKSHIQTVMREVWLSSLKTIVMPLLLTLLRSSMAVKPTPDTVHDAVRDLRLSQTACPN
jgi:hypothetical protein